jgi:hypothetical protein
LSELSIQRKGKEKGQRKRNPKKMVCKGGGEADREGRAFSSSGCDVSALLSDTTNTGQIQYTHFGHRKQTPQKRKRKQTGWSNV